MDGENGTHAGDPASAIPAARAGVGDIEVNTSKGIRDARRTHEFLTPQRLDFDLLSTSSEGTAVHTVDFADYPLSPGDVLWVRAGQVHQWGAIDDIEGPVVMFGPHTVDDRTRDLIRSHWSAPRVTGRPPTSRDHRSSA